MTTAGNDRRFMAAFNTIEDTLRSQVGAEKHVEFKKVVHQAGSKWLTSSQRNALLALTDLRNALVHERYRNGEPIADPHDEVVVDIEELASQVARPPTATAALPQAKPTVVDSQTPIQGALSLMHEKDYSQLPVYDDGRYTGLLTTNTIARWVAARFAELDNVAEAVTVGAVLQHREATDDARLVPRAITCVEAIGLLAPAGDATRPTALIISQNGRATDTPLCIVTPSDVGELHNALRPSRSK